MDPRPLQAPETGTRPASSDGQPSPWSAKAPAGAGARPDVAVPPRDEGLPGPFQGLPAGLVERRLIRRAEALWDECRAGDGPPPATALAAFSAPGLADHAMLFAASGGPGACRLARRQAGPALAALLAPDRRIGAAGEPIAQRLQALAMQAVTLGRPAALEVEPADGAAAEGDCDLLLRAIALPFAAAPRPGPAAGGCAPWLPAAVLVVVSWRQLLSAEETRALRRELAEALDRLRHGD